MKSERRDKKHVRKSKASDTLYHIHYTTINIGGRFTVVKNFERRYTKL